MPRDEIVVTYDSEYFWFLTVDLWHLVLADINLCSKAFYTELLFKSNTAEEG